MGAVQCGVTRFNDAELDPDRVAFFVVIFHLGLGKGGFFNGRPHHRF